MKKFLILGILLSLQLCLNAQDVIVKKDAKTIVCKVLEISDSEVKYKMWANLEGPTYILKTSEISAINFSNGTSQSFENKTEQDAFYNKTEKPIHVVSQDIANRNDLEKKKVKANATTNTHIGNTIDAIGAIGGGLVAGVAMAGFMSNGNHSDGAKVILPIFIGAIGGFTGWFIAHTFNPFHDRASVLEDVYSINTTHIYQHQVTPNRYINLDVISDNKGDKNTIGVGYSYYF